MLLLLLICWIIAGVTAEVPPKMHYGLKNSSLCLRVVKPPPYIQDTWLFKDDAMVVNKNITPNFTEKVNYNPADQSLCINKLTETDSGLYTFSFFDAKYKRSTETHTLVVQEAVPKPVIRMSGVQSNLSAGLCNITVNCSVQDEWVLSVCDEERCRTSQRSSYRTVNITIYTDNRSVVCRGSNSVSTSNESESVEAVCFKISNPEHEKTTEPQTLLVILIGVAVCVSLCLFAVCVAKWFLSTEDNHQQAPAAQIIQSQPVEVQLESLQRVSSSSSSQAEACYENVDVTQPCQTSSPTISPRQEFGSKQKVDTVYSVLEAPKMTSSVGSDSSKEHDEVQEALTTQYASLEGAELPVQINTVYSVLQKPKNLQPKHHQ